MRLTFTRSAQQDLARLHAFIAVKNPQAARRIGQELRDGIQTIADQPRIGVKVAAFPGLRDLVRGDYIVRYIERPDEVCILRVWHGKEERSGDPERPQQS